jgi:hypothetical protein
MDSNPIQYQRHQGPQNKFQSQPPNRNAQYLHRHHKTQIIKAQINRSRDKLNLDPTHNQQTRRQRLPQMQGCECGGGRRTRGTGIRVGRRACPGRPCKASSSRRTWSPRGRRPRCRGTCPTPVRRTSVRFGGPERSSDSVSAASK